MHVWLQRSLTAKSDVSDKVRVHITIHLDSASSFHPLCLGK